MANVDLGLGDNTGKSIQWWQLPFQALGNWLTAKGREFDEKGLYGGFNAAQSGGAAGQNPLVTAGQGQIQAGNVDLGNAVANADAQEVINQATESAGNDAFSYANIQGQSVEDKLQWLVNNDPENAQGWLEQLLGWQANQQAINEARDYDKMMSDTAVQRRMKDLEAAGINPILAVQSLSSTGGGLSAAGFPDSNVSTNAVNVAKEKSSNATKIGVAGLTALVSILAMMFKHIK